MTVDTINGIEIGYDVAGAGLPVLFTHGYQASRRMWAPNIDAISDICRPITWDMRGHGDSGIPDDPSQYSHELLLGDMLGLLDHVGADQAVLLGHSLGGYASLLFYVAHPERVKALVLFGSGPGFRDAEARGKWNEMAEKFAKSISERGLDILQKATAEVSSANHRSATALAHAARGMLAQKDSTVMDVIGSISVPTLVIVGTEDKAFLAGSEYMAKKIPGAELAMIPGAGHAANMEKPDEFNAALRGFLGQLV